MLTRNTCKWKVSKELVLRIANVSGMTASAELSSRRVVAILHRGYAAVSQTRSFLLHIGTGIENNWMFFFAFVHSVFSANVQDVGLVASVIHNLLSGYPNDKAVLFIYYGTFA